MHSSSRIDRPAKGNVALQIKDLDSGDMIRIGDEGMSFGRDPRRSDVPVADPGVSGLHARITLSDGRWLLEDLKSSNGSYVNGERITAPIELKPGMQFLLHRHAFEVVATDGEVTESKAEWVDDAETRADIDPQFGDYGNEVSGGSAPKSVAKTRRESRDVGTPDSGAFDEVSDRFVSAELDLSGGVETGEVSSDIRTPPSTEAPLVPFALKTFPEAFAYYAVAVPSMLLNPMGAIRNSVDEQSFEPLGFKELVAWGLPSWLIGLLLTTVVSTIATIVSGGAGLSLFTGPLFSGIVLVVIAVVNGLVWHPVTGWLVRVCKGRSNARARSNYFIAFMTAMPIMSIAEAIGGLFALIPVPFVGIIGPVVSLAGLAIMVFLAFAWLQFFKVLQWVVWATLALGALGALSTVGAMIAIVKADITRLKGDGDTEIAIVQMDAEGEIAVADTSQAQMARAAALTTQIQRLKDAGAFSPEAEAALRAQMGVPAQRTPGGGDTKPGAVTPRELEAGTLATDSLAKDERPEPAGSAAPAEAAEAPRAAAKAPTRFAAFVTKRDEIERAIAQEPALLKKKQILLMYRRLHVQTNKVRNRYRPKKGRRQSAAEYQADVLISEHLADADAFAATGELVNKLHARIFK